MQLESFLGARLVFEILDTSGILMRQLDLKFFWKVTMEVTKVARLSPYMPGLPWRELTDWSLQY
jgi:hypothetical protein